MKTTITHQYQISLPEALLAEAGLREGEALDCRVYEGAVCLVPEGAGKAWENRRAGDGKKKIRTKGGSGFGGAAGRQPAGNHLLRRVLPVCGRTLPFDQ